MKPYSQLTCENYICKGEMLPVGIGLMGLLILSAGIISIVGLNDDINQADAAVVLGNTVNPDGKPD